MKKINDWIENHIWSFSLILTVIFSPLIIWGAWDTITAAKPLWLKIVLGLGSVVATYIGASLLLIWNRWTQRKYREKGIIK